MKDQTYLNYVGRLVYSFRNNHYQLNEFEVSIKENLFRKEKQKLYGQADRSFEHEVKNIADAIILKRLIDRSIFCEIELIGEKNICHSTYTNSFKFSDFTSNIEDHYFSKNGLHITNSPYAKTIFLRKFISSFIEAILAATNNLYLMAK